MFNVIAKILQGFLSDSELYFLIKSRYEVLHLKLNFCVGSFVHCIIYVYLTVFTNGTKFYSPPKLITNLHTGSLYYKFSGFVNRKNDSILCVFLTHKRYATNYKKLAEREFSSV